ncbi:MAG TPA: cytochrome P450 [Thermoanaerobaculia bacterium]|nr:cytochrome P450 [Thermoanaerobaculia bacterium]
MTAIKALRRIAGSLARRLLGVSRPAMPAALDFDTIGDPFAQYERLRRTGSVHFLPHHHGWIVLGHEDVQAVLARPDDFSNRPYDDVDAVLLAADPPEHTPVRRAVMRYFSRETVEALGAFAEEFAAAQLQRPRLDAVRDYGQAVSEAVAARLIGISGGDVAEIQERAARAQSFADWIAAVDAVAPRASMYERLIADGFDSDRARSLVRLMWLASTKTSERSIASAVYRLLKHDDVRPALQADATLIPAFVGEVLRLHQPEPILRRIALHETVLGGATIPAGAMVYVCLAAANRDAAAYDDPAAFRLDRSAAKSLSFGHGIHHCVGAMLARLEIAAAVRALLREAPSFRAAQSLDDVRHHSSMMAYYIESLMIETGHSGAVRA